MQGRVKLITLSLLLIVLCCTTAYPLLTDAGINPLEIGGGARAGALGEAYTAVSDDVNSIFYNPANISRNKGIFFSIQDTGNFSVGQATTMPYGTLGLGMVHRNYMNFPYMSTTANYDSSAVFLGYAFPLHDLSQTYTYLDFLEYCDFGLSYKQLLGQRLSPSGSSDLTSVGNSGFDAGFLYDTGSFYKAALRFENAGGVPYTLGATKEVNGGNAMLGLSLNIMSEKGEPIYKNPDHSMMFSLDYGLSGKMENRRTLGMGFEIEWFKGYEFRLGVKQAPKSGVDTTYISFGLGIRTLPNLNIDISSQGDPVTEGSTTYFSFCYMPPVFGYKTPEDVVMTQDIVKITYPKEDLVTFDNSLKITGYVLKGASLYINSMMVFVGENQSFSTDMPLTAGKNLIEIKGEYKGNKKLIQLKVLRKAKVVIAEEEAVDRILKGEVKNRQQDLSARAKSVNDKLKQAKKDEDKILLATEAVNIVQEQAKLEKEKTELETKKKTIEQRKEKVENLVTLGIVEVTPERKFEIESVITRGEMVSWLVKAANLPIPEITVDVFKDVPKTHKFAPYIKAAVNLGLVQADKDNMFYPDKPMTKADGQELFRSFGVIK